ncbi:hypothetical protein [Roseateles noduli]|uniref:hypothetical protein n=1 Tax=Roseateles noduli TaxID=2052484 RepID=UPI003D64D98F
MSNRHKGSRSHPLLVGLAQHFEKVREARYDDNGILRPYKLSMPDVLSSRGQLGAAIDLARALYTTLEARGHRVALVGRSEQIGRAELDLREVAQKGRYLQSTWSPDRATVVYIDGFPVGLTLFEMTEQVEMVHVGNSKYMPVRDLSPDQRRRFANRSAHWTTTQDWASGRFCLQAYCGVRNINWFKRWPEAKPRALLGLLPSITQELEEMSPILVDKVAAAKAEAEERHRRWQEDMRRRREEEARAAQAKRREESRADLMNAIAQWDQVRRTHDYFAAVEGRVKAVGEGSDTDLAEQLRERLAKARDLIGPLDPVALLRTWKSPEERG